MSNWEILNIAPNSSKEEIKKAYKKKALIHHPDKGGDKDKFLEVTNAYQELMNHDENAFDGLQDIFSIFKMFVNMTTRSPKVKASEITKSLTLTEIYMGGTYEVEYIRKHYGKPIHVPEHKKIGVFVIEQSSFVPSILKTENDKIKIYIEPGFPYGKRIILKNKGDIKPNHENGDLIVTINEIEHPSFRRVDGIGNDLEIDLDITIKESLLGFDRYISLLNSSRLPIKKIGITKPGDRDAVYRGMTEHNKLYVNWKIIYPDELSETQKNMLDSIF